MEKVLVTGASGYIALHCITELLKNGYAVRGSLRSMNRENEVREAVKKEVSDNNLEICELDLLNDEDGIMPPPNVNICFIWRHLLLLASPKVRMSLYDQLKKEQ